MVDYPYTLKTSTLEDFLKNMPNRPEPTGKVTTEYLQKQGYTSSNDFPMISVMKFIGFLDSGGNITESFKQFRDTGKAKYVMAQALRASYKEVFDLFTDPSKENLENYFRTATGRANRALAATEGTFKTLCKFTDLSSSETTITLKAATPAIATSPSTAGAIPMAIPTQPIVQFPASHGENGVNVTVNVRIELPATDKIDVYDKIFESLKKHILTPSSAKTD
jgi:hypothetical protein